MTTFKIALLTSLALSLCNAAFAAVDHIDVTYRKPILEGKSFGDAGSYELIKGRVTFKVQPDELHNRTIVDLAYAPRDAQGAVEFSSDFWMVRPVDLQKGNGAMLVEIPNRGRRSVMALLGGGSGNDPTAKGEWGDPLLLREGYTFVSLGWQWDIPDSPDLLRLYAPIAHAADGTSFTGLIRHDFTLSEKSKEVRLAHVLLGTVGGLEYAPSDIEDPRNVLTVRETPSGAREIIPRAHWKFSSEKGNDEANKAVAPENKRLTQISYEQGFEPGKIYELVYVVKDPVVAGLGLAAVRDFTSYAKYTKNDIVYAARTYAMGFSQTGRFLRHFVYQGFNADEAGRQALDGVMSIIAGTGRGSFNHRFAQPSRDASPMSSFFYPTDIFPFTDLPERDPKTGAEAGLLDAAEAAHVVPKIFYVNTSYEYWARAASLTHTTADSSRDMTLPSLSRSYFFTGMQHFPGEFPPNKAFDHIPDLRGQNMENPNPGWFFLRAMLSNMNQWVRDGVEPPPSAYPHIGDKTLVPAKQLSFPKLAGVRLPPESSPAWSLDFGKSWKLGLLERQPPLVKARIETLVPQVDADGNEIAGVRTPQLAVPLGTYTGWNFRDPSIGAPEQRLPFVGSYFPFPLNAEKRAQANDPRLSIAERYSSEEDYVARYQAAADALLKARWLLPSDVPYVVKRGKQEWQYAQKAGAN